MLAEVAVLKHPNAAAKTPLFTRKRDLWKMAAVVRQHGPTLLEFPSQRPVEHWEADTAGTQLLVEPVDNDYV
jgi:hypothetical protein